jgi:sugar phosphate isomerase/epimerase
VDAVIDWLGETGGTELPISDNRLVDQPLDAYRKAAEEYMAVAEKCSAAGITVSYHNHSWEFRARDGRLPIEVLYEACDPAMVRACVDVYWVRDGGVDPAAFVAKHADRIRILHAKDSYREEVGRQSYAPVGSGVLDWPAIMKALEPSACPWVVVEQDTPEPEGDAARSSAASRRYLRETFSL